MRENEESDELERWRAGETLLGAPCHRVVYEDGEIVMAREKRCKERNCKIEKIIDQ